MAAKTSAAKRVRPRRGAGQRPSAKNGTWLELLEQVAALAGVKGVVEPYGGSLIIRGRVSGRRCDIGLGKYQFWVVADTSWDLPKGASVVYAPVGSYERTRSLHEDGPFARSSDRAFDSKYLVGGEDAQLCLGRLTASGRRALRAAAWLRPTVSWWDLSPPRRRRNVEVTQRPPAAYGSRRRAAVIKTLARRVTATIALARALER